MTVLKKYDLNPHISEASFREGENLYYNFILDFFAEKYLLNDFLTLSFNRELICIKKMSEVFHNLTIDVTKLKFEPLVRFY